MAGVVIVGDCDASIDSAAPVSSAFASPKSSTFTVPSGAHLDVRRLQIAMNDALLVRRFERLGDLPGDRQRFVERDRPCAMRSASVGPSTSSITSALDAVGVLQAVDRRDVRMIQRGQDFRLALEPREPLGIAATEAGSTLMATARFRLVSVAR